MPTELISNKATEIINTLNNDEIVHLINLLSDTSTNQNMDKATWPELKILFGSHSGNSKIVAAAISELALANKVNCNVVNMAEYEPQQITEESNVLFIVSTHGEGEPPASASELHGFLQTKKSKQLHNLNFIVIALGDSSYKYFCQTGIEFHESLEKHGAKALTYTTQLDVDFEDSIDEIASGTLRLFLPHLKPNANTNITTTKKTKNSIFLSEILGKKQLNREGSNKETYHIELSLKNSGINYQPGDALEVFPVNDENLVDEILKKLSVTGNETVSIKKELGLFREALTYRFEITVITVLVLEKLAPYTEDKSLQRLLNNKDELDIFLRGSDLLDILNTFKFNINPQQLANTLRLLPPRAYSISSAQSQVGNQVHLTISPVRYNKNNRSHKGVASTYFADRLKLNETIGIKLKPNTAFRLPDKNESIIMIGPGTGIAPFRSFLQEREANKHSGKNWLFFGDQHRQTDFLYESEFENYLRTGVLNKLDLAFSRDHEKKIYVQDRLQEHASEVYKWIKNGAHIYVCGDKNNMAKDVKNTFISIIQKHENISFKQAEEKVNYLRKHERYHEDVY